MLTRFPETCKTFKVDGAPEEGSPWTKCWTSLQTSRSAEHHTRETGSSMAQNAEPSFD